MYIRLLHGRGAASNIETVVLPTLCFMRFMILQIKLRVKFFLYKQYRHREIVEV
jgi:hypothetical protein